MEKPINQVAIIGVGLIGGSLARVLKNRGVAKKIVGSGRSQSNMDKALELGVIDESLPAEEAVKFADVIFLCGPVLSILPTLEKLAPHIKDGALVTDAGSTKLEITETAQKIANGRFTFIGSHPIAGTEKSGVENSFETLFDKHKCIITPPKNPPAEQLKLLEQIWQSVGMETVIMDAKMHDSIMGGVSHLPHLVVYALVNAVSDLNDEKELIRYAAGGFKDFTRIGSSSPEMWADISMANSDILSEQVGKVIRNLEEIKKALDSKNHHELKETFKKSQKFRGGFN